jgi:peptide/bleomycin uptake transporter
MLFWYFVARDLGESLSLGWLIGIRYPALLLAESADDTAKAAFAVAQNLAIDVWLYQYMIVAGAIFAGAWARLAPHRWFWWSVVAASVILFVVWFQVQLDVMINNWFGTFYDTIQKALGTPNSVEIGDYFAQLTTFLIIAMVYIFVAVCNAFLDVASAT